MTSNFDNIEKDAMFDIDSGPNTGMPRENLVDTATNFLLNPRSRVIPSSRQRAFFEQKGLTPVEIDMAFQRSMIVGSFNQQSSINQKTLASSSWMEVISKATMGIAMMSTTAYAFYWFWKTYIEPRMGPSRVEVQIEQLLQMLREQNEERRAQANEASQQTLRLSQSLMELRQEVASLKKMSLGRSQFALSPSDATLPIWQRAPASDLSVDLSDNAQNDGVETKSNGTEGHSEVIITGKKRNNRHHKGATAS